MANGFECISLVGDLTQPTASKIENWVLKKLHKNTYISNSRRKTNSKSPTYVYFSSTFISICMLFGTTLYQIEYYAFLLLKWLAKRVRETRDFCEATEKSEHQKEAKNDRGNNNTRTPICKMVELFFFSSSKCLFALHGFWHNGPIWFCKSKAKFVFTHLRFHKIGGEKQRELVWEYERDAVLEVLDTVDNSILSTQSTCYCCYWCCCCYSSTTCSWCLLNVFVLFALNANVQIAFCIVDVLLPRKWHHFILAWENTFPDDDGYVDFYFYSGTSTYVHRFATLGILFAFENHQHFSFICH